MVSTFLPYPTQFGTRTINLPPIELCSLSPVYHMWHKWSSCWPLSMCSCQQYWNQCWQTFAGSLETNSGWHAKSMIRMALKNQDLELVWKTRYLAGLGPVWFSNDWQNIIKNDSWVLLNTMKNILVLYSDPIVWLTTIPVHMNQPSTTSRRFLWNQSENKWCADQYEFWSQPHLSNLKLNHVSNQYNALISWPFVELSQT